MRPGIFNIVIGLIAVGLGATGKFKLLFTQSSLALMVVGGAIAAFGVFQLLRSRNT
jgi:hypothetical protein